MNAGTPGQNAYGLNFVSGSVNVAAGSTAPALGSFGGVVKNPFQVNSKDVGIGTMIQLPDGSVISNGGFDNASPNWYRLIPDSSGNYSSGTWHALAASNVGRLFYGSVVLPTGQVLIVGGEYTNISDAITSVVGTGSGPIQVTTSTALAPYILNGNSVNITGVTGFANGGNNNFNVNGGFSITVTGTNTFTLNGTGGVVGTGNANTGTVGVGDTNTGEMFTPPTTPGGTGSWQNITPFPNGVFGDGNMELMSDGTVLTEALSTNTTYRYNPAMDPLLNPSLPANTNPWIQDASLPAGFVNDETAWTKLPDGSILSYVIISNSGTQTGFRFVPGATIAQDQWVATGAAPTPQGSNGGSNIGNEMGPGFLLPDGRVFIIGASGNTAIYTPPALAHNSTGSYVAGPTVPDGMGATDAPGAMMPNGDVLFAVSPYITTNGTSSNPAPVNAVFNSPTQIDEYNPTTNTISVVSPSQSSKTVFVTRMLNLPNGQVMFTDQSSSAFVYSPNSAPNGTPTPLDAWRPVITNIKQNSDGSFTLTGTQITGISEGSGYGDDAQMATNFPIVQIATGGNTLYATTSAWSTANVATGATPESVKFTLPSGVSLNQVTSFTVIANGIASKPVSPLLLGSGNENLVIMVDPNDSTTIDVFVDGGGLIAQYANNSASTIAIFGDGNNNRVTVLETYGVVNTPISFDGGGSSSAPGDQLLVVGGSGPDSLNLAPITPTSASMSFDGSEPYSYTNIQQFGYYGAGGNDTMTVDSSMSLSSVPIFYDGDNGFLFVPGQSLIEDGPQTGGSFSGGNGLNSLILTQAGGSTQTSDVYNVGPNPGEGSDVIAGGGVTQTVTFENLAPVYDSVPATTLTVNATNASNAINYMEGNDATATPNVGWGQVSVDNLEPMNFTAKTNLVINALAGSDTINLNNTHMPTGLTGNITVNGNDPTLTDHVITNGTSGNDTPSFTPTGFGAGGITGAGPVPILVTGMADLTYNGQGGLDNFTYTAPSHASVVFTPSPTAGAGSGSFTATTYPLMNAAQLLNFDFTNIGSFAEGTIVSASGMHDLSFTYNGTEASDQFGVQNNSPTADIVSLNNGNSGPEMLIPGVSDLTLNGLGANDSFVVVGTLVTPVVNIDGGEQSNGDSVSLISLSASGPVLVSGAGDGVTVDGYNPDFIVINSVESVDVNSGSNPVTFSPFESQIPVTWTYTPTSALGGALSEDGIFATFTFITSSTATVIGTNDGSGSDQLIVNGTNNSDFILANAANRTVTVENAAGTDLKTITIDQTIEQLTVNGRLGTDTFFVVPSPVFSTGTGGGATTATVPTNLLVDIEGGPTANTDALVVGKFTNGAGTNPVFAGTASNLAATDFTIINRSTDPNAGVVRIYRNIAGTPTLLPDITYHNVGNVSPLVSSSANLLILGADAYEQDEFLATAAFLGSGATINAPHESIFPNVLEHRFAPADQDYYRVVAQSTGTLDFQVYFRLFAATQLPGGGNLNLEVLDANGDVVGTAAGGAAAFGAVGATANARVRIPVVAGQTYYLHVFGANADGTPNGNVVNGYDMTIVNTPTPVPFDLELSRSVTTAGAPDTGDLPTNAPGDDSGRSQFDNVTNINTPTIYLRVNDAIFLNDLPGNGAPNNPPAGVIPIPFSPTGATAGFRLAIFDGNNTSTPVGFATPVAGFPGVYQYTFTTALADGVHNLVARVQMVDPANPTETGFGDQSISLAITVDTAPPPVAFGTTANGNNGLDAGSDSGWNVDQPTLSDRITNVTNPTFYGTAESNAIIKVYAVATAGPLAGTDVLIAQTTAVPIDGTNADPNGRWSVQSNINLNDPNFFSLDGERTIHVTAEDLAGNVSAEQTMNIFIDTQGPQISSIQIGGSPGYNIFAEKSANNVSSPTPLVYALDINVQDLPPRVADFLYNAIETAIVDGQEFIDPVTGLPVPGEFANGGITLVGDATGPVSFYVTAVNNPPTAGNPATAVVTLHFVNAQGQGIPLPDDRYTLTIDDTVIVDPVGNKLDGESNASGPINVPTFPTGNGVPGGKFTGSFSVDSRPEVGDYAASRIYEDTNGDFVYDPQNPDATNRDLTLTLQIAPSLVGVVSPMGVHDAVFTGEFANPAPPTGAPIVANGFDELAAFGYDPVANNGAGGFRWLIDVNGDGVINPASGDIAYAMPTSFKTTGIPLAGNFQGDTPAALKVDGDELALFTGTAIDVFKIDYTQINPQTGTPGVVVLVSATPTNLRGYPIVGDFNGDGIVDLATWKDDVYYFNLGTQPGGPGTPVVFSGNIDTTINFGLPGNGEVPVAADMNQDGITDIGLWVPGRAGTVPQDSAEFFFLMSSDLPTTAGGTPPVAFPPTLTTDADLPASIAFINQELNHPFSPAPLGTDLYAQFGDEFATPIVGNWDPPLSASAVTGSADSTAPTSSVNALPTSESSPSFTVSWSGQDNAGGSGIASYDVYVSDNGGAPLVTDTTATSATFTGVANNTYSFFSVATDKAGNVEATPAAAETTTTMNIHVATTTALTASVGAIVPGQTVTFTATVSDLVAGAGVPTGTVTFKDGATVLATIALQGGVASYSTSGLSVASHSITANYAANGVFIASASAPLVQKIQYAALEADLLIPGGTVLYVAGTSGNDTITFTPANAGGGIAVAITNSATKNVAQSQGTFSGVGRIVAYGLAGNDVIQLKTAQISGKTISIATPAMLLGGDGNDTLTGGNGNDVLVGGTGTDTLSGEPGPTC